MRKILCFHLDPEIAAVNAFGISLFVMNTRNVAAAIRLAKKLGKGKTVVTVLPDTAERYFSTPLFR